jgi:hypothetical protein
VGHVNLVDDSPHTRDLTHESFRLGSFAHPANGAGQGYRAAIDMDADILGNSRVIIERLPGCGEDVQV